MKYLPFLSLYILIPIICIIAIIIGISKKKAIVIAISSIALTLVLSIIVSSFIPLSQKQKISFIKGSMKYLQHYVEDYASLNKGIYPSHDTLLVMLPRMISVNSPETYTRYKYILKASVDNECIIDTVNKSKSFMLAYGVLTDQKQYIILATDQNGNLLREIDGTVVMIVGND